jgi:hypothetical protein
VDPEGRVRFDDPTREAAYLRGHDLLARNIEVDDLDGYYNLQRRFAMIWRYESVIGSSASTFTRQRCSVRSCHSSRMNI